MRLPRKRNFVNLLSVLELAQTARRCGPDHAEPPKQDRQAAQQVSSAIEVDTSLTFAFRLDARVCCPHPQGSEKVFTLV